MNNLTERYVYAVTFHLPKETRLDVEKELRGLIADALEARCGDFEPTDADIKAVLTELGTPEQLAAKYSGDERLAFISGMYFIVYKKVLSIVLPLVAIAVFLGNAIMVFVSEKLNEPGVLIPKLIFSSVGGGIGAAFETFAVITLVFAVLERKKVIISSGNIVSGLPPVPKSKIPLFEPIINIISIIFIGWVLMKCPWIIGVLFGKGVGIAAFNADVILSMWGVIALWVAVQITREVICIVDRSYTRRVALATVACNAVVAVLTGILFLNSKLMNADFVSKIRDVEYVGGTLANLNVIVWLIILLVLIIEVLRTAVKAKKNVGFRRL